MEQEVGALSVGQPVLHSGQGRPPSTKLPLTVPLGWHSRVVRRYLDLMRLVSVCSAVALSIAAAPAYAAASTVSVEPESGRAVFTSGPGASDVTTVDAFSFADALQPLVPGVGCASTPPTVTCEPTSTQQFLLGAGDDRLSASSRGVGEMLVSGGPGADDVDVSATAGTTVAGGAGADTVQVDADGGTSARGDAGDDRLRGGGAFTELRGNGGDDLIASGAFNTLPNQLDGGPGDDRLILDVGTGVADGGAGADTLVALAVDAVGAWTFAGGPGADTIATAGRGGIVDAGRGADAIDASGGAFDAVTCGPGADLVYADAEDTVAADCEVVELVPAPALTAAGAALTDYAAAFPPATG